MGSTYPNFALTLSYSPLLFPVGGTETEARKKKKGIPFTLVALPSIPAGWGIMESGCENKHTSIKWGK